MDNEIIQNVKYYIDLALRRPLYLLVPAAVVILAGLIVILQLPRTYTSEAIIEVRSTQAQNPLIASTVENERLRFIEQRVLARDQLLGLVQRLDLFPDVREQLTDSKLAELVRKQIQIIPLATEESQQYAGRSIFRVEFSYDDRDLAAQGATEVINMIIRENRQSRTSTAAETSQFLEGEVARLSEQAQEQDKEWQSFLEQNSNALPSRVETMVEELNTRGQDLTELNRSIAALDDEIKLLEAQYRWNAPLADSAAAARQKQLEELRTELATKSSTMADAHPEIRSLHSRIAYLEQQIASANKSNSGVDPATLSPELGLIAERIELSKPRREALIKQRDELTARIEWLRGNINRAPEVEAQMASLERTRTAMQRSLEDLRAKLDTARIGLRLEEDHNADQIQIVEAPEVPRYPSAPSRTKLMLVVVVLAGMAGAACLYLSDFLDKNIRGAFDLRRSLDGQAVVVIPDLQPKSNWLTRRLGLAASVFLLTFAAQGMSGGLSVTPTTADAIAQHAVNA